MEMRPFQAGDKPAVIELWKRSGLVRPQNDPQKDIRRKLRVNPEMFLVAVEDGMIAGTVMAGYEGHRGWINYLAVDPGLRRRGMGCRLMLEAERLLRQAGCPKINLQIRANNHDAIAFYEAIGFDIDDVVSMGKRLERD